MNTEKEIDTINNKMETLETKMVKLEKDVEYLGKEIKDVKEETHDINHKIDAMHKRFDTFSVEIRDGFVRNREFVFWRNLLVSGLLLTIAVGVVMGILSK
jgi:predicted  nucleic acid-binding Zn-ribbon protein